MLTIGEQRIVLRDNIDNGKEDTNKENSEQNIVAGLEETVKNGNRGDRQRMSTEVASSYSHGVGSHFQGCERDFTGKRANYLLSYICFMCKLFSIKNVFHA